LDAIVPYNELTTNLGQKADAASSTGTAHAKLKDIKDYLTGSNIVTYGTAIKSIQKGKITIGNSQTSGTATITSVTTSKAFVLPLGVSLNGAEGATAFFCRLELTNSTTVTATRGGTSANDLTAGYVVIEFY